MADRIGVINRGEIIVVDDKKELMKKLGRKQLILDLKAPVAAVPTGFSESLTLNADKTQLIYTYDTVKGDSGIAELLAALSSKGIAYRDIHTETSSLEDIFIQLVKDK